MNNPWEDCQDTFDDTDYGADEGQSNFDYFKVHNPEDVGSDTTNNISYSSYRRSMLFCP